MTTIINYNLGNPKSIKNMFTYLGFESRICPNQEDIASADRLILPGVGHFQQGMGTTRETWFGRYFKERGFRK